VHGRDVAPVVVTGVLEGELRDAPARLLGDELDALHDPVHDHMLNAAVFSFRVLPNGDDVYVSVRGFIALDRYTRPDICIKVKCFTQQ